jgi:glutathione S-transferase
MELFTSLISPAGKRVRICAHELGVSCELALLDFQKGDNRAPAYLALNPMGKIPTLKTSDFTLWESGAILCYLANKHQSPLWSHDPQTQAETLRWLFFCSCHIDPYFTTLVVERFIKARRGAEPDAALTNDAERWIARFAPVVEDQLKTREYILGNFGLADIALGCTLELSPLVRFDLAPYPNIGAWLARLHARESWRKNIGPMDGARS